MPSGSNSDTPPLPVELANGRTGADGVIDLNVPVTSDVLQAATENAGMVNISIQGWCVVTDSTHQTCADPNSTVARVTPVVDTVLILAFSTYMNVAAPAEDAASSGIQGVETQTRREVWAKTHAGSGDFNPFNNIAGTCDGDQSCNAGNSSTQGACQPGDGTVWESFYSTNARIAQGHSDYGQQAGMVLGETMDTDWTIGFKAGAGASWSLAGTDHVGTETDVTETTEAPPKLSGDGNTKIHYLTKMRFGLLRNQVTRYQNGNASQPWCDKVWWTHNLGRVVHTDSQGKVIPDQAVQPCCWEGDGRDRAWQSGYITYNISGDVYRNVYNSGKVKYESTSSGISVWGFTGSYSTGSSSLESYFIRSGSSYAPCSNGWRIYYNNTTPPNAANNMFVDAGYAGSGSHTVNGVAVPDLSGRACRAHKLSLRGPARKLPERTPRQIHRSDCRPTPQLAASSKLGRLRVREPLPTTRALDEPCASRHGRRYRTPWR
jgi:hypothetical protein